MFETLPAKFRDKDLNADVRVLLLFRKAINKGLVKTLGDTYQVLKGLVVKDQRDLGPFTKVFYDYFLNIDIENGETLHDAVLRSETFRKWLEDHDLKDKDILEEDLVNKFLDDVHLTTYDIKQILSGKEIWDKDNPDLEDETSGDSIGERRAKHLEKMADYSDLSLEELLERMRKVAEQQKSEHEGGSHWLGTGGISPYGHGGAAKNGIRTGGPGGGKMARKVIGDHNFYPVDLDKIINDDNVDAALASLKGIVDETGIEKLDVEQTIKKGLKRGGLFIPEIKREHEQTLKVLLLIDNGGYSMTPYVNTVRELFKKMKTRFAHDMETYYFHNTIYDRVFTDEYRSKSIPFDRFLKKYKSDYRIFIIGDASMGPYELNRMSISSYQAMTKKFKRIAWLNPEPKKYWRHSYTLNLIKEIIDMYPLTPKGIEKAVIEMNRV